jgi:aldose 1-epimerase
MQEPVRRATQDENKPIYINMKRFSLQDSKFFSYNTITLTDTKTSNSIEIALRGANVLNYIIDKNGEKVNIIDGFQTLEEFEAGNGARSFIMAPYSNKIDNYEYEFKDAKYKIEPNPSGVSLRHGLVSRLNFEIYSVNILEECIELTLYTNKLRRADYPGYPFDVNVFVKFSFYGDQLKIEIIGENKGKESAPFGAGWHSYFKTSENGIDHLQLELNANQIILIDKNSVPLNGIAAYSNIEENPKLDFRKTRPSKERIFGEQPIDVCFTALTDKKDEFYETILSDFQNGIELTIFQSSGVVYTFTGESLSMRPRKAVAIEPVEFMTDSYNRPECAEALELKPGKTKSFTFGVKVKY